MRSLFDSEETLFGKGANCTESSIALDIELSATSLSMLSSASLSVTALDSRPRARRGLGRCHLALVCLATAIIDGELRVPCRGNRRVGRARGDRFEEVGSSTLARPSPRRPAAPPTSRPKKIRGGRVRLG